MLPYKTKRGKSALQRLKAYEGIPPKYVLRRRVVVPRAMRNICLKPGRAYCKVGRLAHEVGWKYQDVIKALEAKRRLRAFMAARKREKFQKFTKEAVKKTQEKKNIKKYIDIIDECGYGLTGFH